MVDFMFKRSVILIREMAFASLDKIYKKKCDVLYLHSNESKPRTLSYAYVQKQYTLVNSLCHRPEEILSGFTKNCRYEIRRAEREGAHVNFYRTIEELDKYHIIDKFEETYNDMFKAKNISSVFNRSLITAAAREKHIVISTCSIEGKDNCVVFHAYLADLDSTVLMYSASSLWKDKNKDRVNCIGRLNKYLHWKDIEWFHSHHYSCYEWGGISDPNQPNGIDRFKGEFGGKIACYYNYLVPYSFLGKIYIYLVKRRTSKC